MKASSEAATAAKALSRSEGSAEEELAFLRKRNAMYSKKKYYKKKREISQMTETVYDLSAKNNKLKRNNAELEALLVDCERRVLHSHYPTTTAHVPDTPLLRARHLQDLVRDELAVASLQSAYRYSAPLPTSSLVPTPQESLQSALLGGAMGPEGAGMAHYSERHVMDAASRRLLQLQEQNRLLALRVATNGSNKWPSLEPPPTLSVSDWEEQASAVTGIALLRGRSHSRQI